MRFAGQFLTLQAFVSAAVVKRESVVAASDGAVFEATAARAAAGPALLAAGEKPIKATWRAGRRGIAFETEGTWLRVFDAPSGRCLPGDQILSVNGATDPEEMKAHLRGGKEIEVTLRRPGLTPEHVAGGWFTPAGHYAGCDAHQCAAGTGTEQIMEQTGVVLRRKWTLCRADGATLLWARGPELEEWTRAQVAPPCLLHHHLADYTKAELQAALAEPVLLQLVLTDIMRMQALRTIPNFSEKFPHNYGERQQAGAVVAVASSVGKELAVDQLGLAHAAKYAVKFAKMGHKLELTAEKLEKLMGAHQRMLQAADERLADKGAALTTSYWADVPVGAVWSAFLKVEREVQAFLTAPSVLVKPCGTLAQHTLVRCSPLPNGDLLCAPLPIVPGRPAQACSKALVQDKAWYLGGPDPEPIDDEAWAVQPGEAVLVVAHESPTEWRLGDGRLVRAQDLEGPVAPPTAAEVSPSLLLGVDHALHSGAAIATRVSLASIFFVGGFANPAFWAAAMAVNLGDAVGSGVMALGAQGELLRLVPALVQGAAQFEMGLLERLDCDVLDDARACEPGEACLHAGAFALMDQRRGSCVPAARPQLKAGSYCSVHLDCETSVCAEHACRAPCELGATGCIKLGKDYGYYEN